MGTTLSNALWIFPGARFTAIVVSGGCVSDVKQDETMEGPRDLQYRYTLLFEDGAEYSWLERAGGPGEGPKTEGQWTSPFETEDGQVPAYGIVEAWSQGDIGPVLLEAHGEVRHVRVTLDGRDADTQLSLFLTDLEGDLEYQCLIAGYPSHVLGGFFSKDPIVRKLVRLLRAAPNVESICEKQLTRWFEGLKKGEMLERLELVQVLLFAMVASKSALGRQLRYEFAGIDHAELASIRDLAKTLSVVGDEFRVNGQIVEIE
jgi:hypothetical protein